jgi:hypothetical protein
MIRPPLIATIGAILCLGSLPLIPLGAADDHSGHSHGGHSHGPVVALGSVEIGPHTIKVASSGALVPGGAWHVELAMAPAQAKPKAIRLWVGSENGRGSVKARAASEPGHPGAYNTHVLIPEPLTTNSRLWIALEASDGTTTRGSLDLPKTASTGNAGHHAGDGHKH